MDIQQVFYWLATIAMGLTIVFLLAMVVLLFYVKQKVKDLHGSVKYVVNKADTIVEGLSNQVNALTNLKAKFLGKSPK